MTFTKPLEKQRVKEGLEATFECTVNVTDAKVTWYKGDTKLRKSRKYDISSKAQDKGMEHRLVVKDMRPDDEATITAKAVHSEYGNDTTSARLEFSPEGLSLVLLEPYLDKGVLFCI